MIRLGSWDCTPLLGRPVKELIQDVGQHETMFYPVAGVCLGIPAEESELGLLEPEEGPL